LTAKIRAGIDELVLYVRGHNDGISLVCTIAIYGSIGAGVLAILICLVFEITWIRGNKEKVYTCLTSLPKTNVSQIAENLRVRKRESEDTSTTNSETSKQDDNIIKIFMAGGSNGVSGWIDQLLMIVCVLLTAVCFAICMHLLRTLIVDQATIVTSSSPHMTYLLGAFGALFQALTDVMTMHFFGTPFQSQLWTKTELVERFEWLRERFNAMYDGVRFGNVTGLLPYAGYSTASANAAGQLQCANQLEQAADCFVSDMFYGLAGSLLESRLAIYSEDDDRASLEDPGTVQNLFSLLVYPMYETQSQDPIFIVLTVLAVIFQAGAILEVVGMQTRMRRSLRFLLHCPASVVLQCPKVMSVLSGDFSTGRRDEGAKTAVFFRQVVMQIPDAMPTIEMGTMTITSQNTAAERLFGEETIGTRVADFFGPHWNGPIGDIFAVGADAKGVTEALVFRKTVHTMQDNLVYVFRDTTSTVRYNALIAQERAKSDALLKSSLPLSLVMRFDPFEFDPQIEPRPSNEES
jgi:hypothetical protein